MLNPFFIHVLYLQVVGQRRLVYLEGGRFVVFGRGVPTDLPPKRDPRHVVRLSLGNHKLASRAGARGGCAKPASSRGIPDPQKKHTNIHADPRRRS